jgi:hypothetical protein
MEMKWKYAPLTLGMATRSYASILEGLNSVLALCERLGLGERARGSRFALYGQLLGELIEISRLAREGRFTPAHQAALAARKEEYLAALADGDQIADIAPFLDGFDQDLLRRKLRDVLAGLLRRAALLLLPVP